jgi:alkanesulfonate monooxygenase SsuD/methylene tetrahydromethanopterin reductase-like flavin-dependent oxidoreductase (luciferase family)
MLQIDNLKMVDGAFSEETDPKPNPTEDFETLAHSDIILNARIVGSADTVVKKVKELWTPGLKLIVTTYCQTPEEQADAYDRIHRICSS